MFSSILTSNLSWEAKMEMLFAMEEKRVTLLHLHTCEFARWEHNG